MALDLEALQWSMAEAVAEIRKLREALEPFAAIARHIADVGHDDGLRPTVADCQRADEVLK